MGGAISRLGDSITHLDATAPGLKIIFDNIAKVINTPLTGLILIRHTNVCGIGSRCHCNWAFHLEIYIMQMERDMERILY